MSQHSSWAAFCLLQHVDDVVFGKRSNIIPGEIWRAHEEPARSQFIVGCIIACVFWQM